MPKVSVIIPVYNTDKYLERCLDSVINQTLQDIEIVCINDCSTDNSLEVLKKYASNDNRIILIDLELNKGAADARNIGIENSSGEFLAFLDSDDYPEKDDFYERLYNSAIENSADISKGAYKNSDTMTVDESINEKIKENKEFFCYTYCSAIFKSELIKNNNIRFPNLSDMEDPCFTAQVSKLANYISIVDDCNLIITKRADSLTGKLPSLEHVKDKIKGLKYLFDNKFNSYVLAYWFVTVILDSLKNFNLDVEEYVLYKCSQLFEQKKHDEEFIWHLQGINLELYKYFIKNKFNYYFDKEELKRKIDKHDVISFDIYDTLLLRLFVNRKGIFTYLEEIFNIRDFSFIRLIAERRARIRAKNKEDITYDEIYNSINIKYKDFKQTEKDLEYKFLLPNNEMLEIYNYAISIGKKVIIASDMYLDSDFLAKVLNKNGFKNYYKLYVSSEIGKGKYTGNLFKHIINDLNINAKQMLHIGDNLCSDYQKPKEIGINSYYYKQIIPRVMDLYNKYSLPLYNQFRHNSYNINSLTALQIIYRHNHREDCTYFENLGFVYGASLGIAFANELNIVANARKLTDIFFIARDGYMLKKIYDSLYPNSQLKTHYIYAQRKLRSLCVKEDNNNDYDVEQAKEYSRYIKSIKTNGKKIGIADTCAGAFSAQTLLENYMPKYEFIGVYMTTYVNYIYNYISLSSEPNYDVGFQWDLIELLFSSQEAPVEGIKDLKPIYRQDLNNNDKYKSSVYKDIERGIIKFIKQYTDLFVNEKYMLLTTVDIFANIREFWTNINSIDRFCLNQIKHPVDTMQKTYVSLLSTDEERNNAYKTINKKVFETISKR